MCSSDLYSYILNNPLSGTDPTGYCAEATGSRIKDCVTVTKTFSDGSTETSSFNLRSPMQTAQLAGTLIGAAQQMLNGATPALASVGMNRSEGSTNGQPKPNTIGQGQSQQQDGLIGFHDPCRSGCHPVMARSVSGGSLDLPSGAVATEFAIGLTGLGGSTISMYELATGTSPLSGNPASRILAVVGLIPYARNLMKMGGAAAEATARGGTYVLRDPVSEQVMRSGRTNDLARRGQEHGRDPTLSDLVFEPVHRTDVRSQQRGLEQILHDTHRPALNRINPISPRNPRFEEYMDAAKWFLEGR